MISAPSAVGSSVWPALSQPNVSAPDDAAPVAHTPPPVFAPQLVISLDAASHRFVQVLLERNSAEILRQFPGDGQLAFSRGVSAYVEAVRRAQVARQA